MAHYAALDVGSNSVRLLVAEGYGSQVRLLRAELRSTRLLAGAASGWLQEEAVARTVTAVAELAALARAYRPEKMVCIATSAAREARNPELLRARIAARTGLEVMIISGPEEARLAYQGVQAGFQLLLRHPLVIDIGGGSTELSWQDERGLQLESVRVGAVRVMETAMDEGAIADALTPALARARERGPGCLAGTGGTITTLAAMELGLTHYQPLLVHGTILSAERVTDWHRTLAAMPCAARRQLPGLPPERADIIVAGITILKVILAQAGVTDIVVSETDLLWGLILAMHRGEPLTRG
jgi:exopolyphosphatase/guanosine-5'-triphosphate,3'-diphosphate pyrophosphatase